MFLYGMYNYKAIATASLGHNAITTHLIVINMFQYSNPSWL